MDIKPFQSVELNDLTTNFKGNHVDLAADSQLKMEHYS